MGALDGCPDDSTHRPAMHAVHTQPHRQARRRAAGWVRRGRGAEVAQFPLGAGGGGGRLVGARGRGSRCVGLDRAPCTAAGCRGQGLHLVPSAQVGGTPATCVHACAGGGDGAATLAHFNTGGGGGGRHATATYPRPVTRGYGCAMKPLPRGEGWSPRPLCTTTRRAWGARGGEGYGGLSGRAALCPHAWVRARGTTTRTLRRRRHASTSSRTASVDRAWASPAARGYRCRGGG